MVRKAGFAAAITSIACLPRLTLWAGRLHPIWFLWALLLWAGFVLWAFVFGWFPKYAGQPVFGARVDANVWLAATGCGLLGTFLFHEFVDPVLMRIAPEDYPSTLEAWVAATLFTLGKGQLFLCFAPAAFFLRLFCKLTPAFLLTLGLGALVTILKVNSQATPLPGPLVVQLLALRIITGCLSFYFFLNGGVFVVWWWTLLLQVRHLFDLAL